MMKKLKTTFTVLLLTGALFVSTGVAGAAKLNDEPITTQSIVSDPGTGGGGK